MLRNSIVQKNVAVGTDADGSNSGVIPYSEWAGGVFLVPTGATTTLLTWLAASEIDGVFAPVYRTEAGAEVAVTSVVAAGHRQLLPAALFACRFLKAVGNAATVLTVDLKS